MFDILKPQCLWESLSSSSKNALTDKECNDICKSIEAIKSGNSSEDESENGTATENDSESEDEDINIHQLIEQTVQKVTKNTSSLGAIAVLGVEPFQKLGAAMFWYRWKADIL